MSALSLIKCLETGCLQRLAVAGGGLRDEQTWENHLGNGSPAVFPVHRALGPMGTPLLSLAAVFRMDPLGIIPGPQACQTHALLPGNPPSPPPFDSSSLQRMCEVQPGNKKGREMRKDKSKQMDHINENGLPGIWFKESFPDTKGQWCDQATSMQHHHL